MAVAPGGERGGSAHSSRASSRHSSRHSSRRSSAASGTPSRRHRDSRAGSVSPERAGRAGSVTSQQSARSGRSHVSYRGDVKANDGPAEDDVVPGAGSSYSCVAGSRSNGRALCVQSQPHCTFPPSCKQIISCSAERHDARQLDALRLRTDLAGLQEPATEAAETEAELVERVGQPSFRRRPIRATRKTSSFRYALTPP